MAVDRTEFLAQLASRFPEVVTQIPPASSGLLHLEMAAFRDATERAIDAGHLWSAEQHFRFVERMLREADPELRNALEVSYLVDFALGECTPQRYRAVKERMPRQLHDILIRHHQQWK